MSLFKLKISPGGLSPSNLGFMKLLTFIRDLLIKSLACSVEGYYRSSITKCFINKNYSHYKRYLGKINKFSFFRWPLSNNNKKHDHIPNKF